jgi:hypothetical protein
MVGIDQHRAVAGRVAVDLRFGEQLGQRARQRVDLVRREHRAIGQHGLVHRQQAIEPQQQRPAPAPRDRRHLQPRIDLGERSFERAPPGGAGRERDRGLLALGQERLARELRGPLDVIGRWNDRGLDGHWRGIGH